MSAIGTFLITRSSPAHPAALARAVSSKVCADILLVDVSVGSYDAKWADYAGRFERLSFKTKTDSWGSTTSYPVRLGRHQASGRKRSRDGCGCLFTESAPVGTGKIVRAENHPSGIRPGVAGFAAWRARAPVAALYFYPSPRGRDAGKPHATRVGSAWCLGNRWPKSAAGSLGKAVL